MSGAEIIQFDENGLVPAVVQDARSGRVLTLAYMNREALARTLETGQTHLYSRSRQAQWQKGETSGHTQDVTEVWYDCDEDAVVVKVIPHGPACHTGQTSCFFRTLPAFTHALEAPRPTLNETVDALYGVICDRRDHPRPDSYVSSLVERGLDAIGAKVREEAAELVAAGAAEDRDAVVHEAADLWFHTLVFMAARDVTPADVAGELGRRFGRSGLAEKAARDS